MEVVAGRKKIVPVDVTCYTYPTNYFDPTNIAAISYECFTSLTLVNLHNTCALLHFQGTLVRPEELPDKKHVRETVGVSSDDHLIASKDQLSKTGLLDTQLWTNDGSCRLCTGVQ
jgi:hypothetical protein